MRGKFLYVYILKCSDNSYYIGVTNNPERRLSEHVPGTNPTAYAFSRRPLERVYPSEGFSDFNAAIALEKQLKKWSRKWNEKACRM
jgi:putative endonuclease